MTTVFIIKKRPPGVTSSREDSVPELSVAHLQQSLQRVPESAVPLVPHCQELQHCFARQVRLYCDSFMRILLGFSQAAL